MDECRTSDHLACNRVQKAEGRVQSLERHVAASGSKYSKTVEKSAQAERELPTRVTLLAAELEVEEDCIACFEEDTREEHSED